MASFPRFDVAGARSTGALPASGPLRALGLRALGALALLLGSFHASAFTFADGTSVDCVVGGEVVPEYSPPPGTEAMAFTGQTVKVGSGYQIVWNKQRLDSLPREVHDYLFFHECAHALVPTRDEVRANCVGLQNMRTAGRAGFAVETKLAAFYGTANDYWKNTLSCADARAAPAADAGAAGAPVPSSTPTGR